MKRAQAESHPSTEQAVGQRECKHFELKGTHCPAKRARSGMRCDLLPDVLLGFMATFLHLVDHRQLATCSKKFQVICSKPASFCSVLDLSFVHNWQSTEFEAFLKKFAGSRAGFQMTLVQVNRLRHLEHLPVKTIHVGHHQQTPLLEFTEPLLELQRAVRQPLETVRRLVIDPSLDDNGINLALRTCPNIDFLDVSIEHADSATVPWKTLHSLRVLEIDLPGTYLNLCPLLALSQLTSIKLGIADSLTMPVGVYELPITSLRCRLCCIERETKAIPMCTMLELEDVNRPVPASIGRSFPKLKTLRLSPPHAWYTKPNPRPGEKKWLCALRDLDLDDLSVSIPGSLTTNELPYLPSSLQSLHLSRVDISSDIRHLNRLTTLKLLGTSTVGDALFAPLSSLTNLELTGTVFHGIFPSNLRSLVRTGPIHFSTIAGCSALRSLHVFHGTDKQSESSCDFCRSTTTDGTLTNLAKLPLIVLQLGCTLSVKTAMFLSARLPLDFFAARVQQPTPELIAQCERRAIQTAFSDDF